MVIELKLLPDKQHFTPSAQIDFEDAFCAELNRKLKGNPPSSVLVLADSTIGYYDWKRNTWDGSASDRLAHRIKNMFDAVVHVDSVCGSGFLARAKQNEHFRSRLSAARKSSHWEVVVVVGGWNDEGADLKRLAFAIQGFGRVI